MRALQIALENFEENFPTRSTVPPIFVLARGRHGVNIRDPRYSKHIAEGLDRSMLKYTLPGNSGVDSVGGFWKYNRYPELRLLARQVNNMDKC